MDHQNSNGNSAVDRFARPMGSGDNLEKPIGNQNKRQQKRTTLP